MAEKDERGAAGEAVAAAYLQRAGYLILARNWRGAGGELDLVTRGDGQIVVVEVKTRRTFAYGDPLAAVTPTKLARLWRLGAQWCAAHHALAAGRALRVDVIGIVGDDPATGQLEHLRDVR